MLTMKWNSPDGFRIYDAPRHWCGQNAIKTNNIPNLMVLHELLSVHTVTRRTCILFQHARRIEYELLGCFRGTNPSNLWPIRQRSRLSLLLAVNPEIVCRLIRLVLLHRFGSVQFQQNTKQCVENSGNSNGTTTEEPFGLNAKSLRLHKNTSTRSIMTFTKCAHQMAKENINRCGNLRAFVFVESLGVVVWCGREKLYCANQIVG